MAIRRPFDEQGEADEVFGETSKREPSWENDRLSVLKLGIEGTLTNVEIAKVVCRDP